jgi:toxin YoeB
LSRRKRARPRRSADEKTAAGPPARRQLVFSTRFLDDLRFWVATNPRMAGRLLELVDLVVRDPFHGKGKPEPLQALPDTWSRRLDQEHRLTYRVTGTEIDFMQARYHYEK